MIKKFISFFTSFILITGMLFNINVFANENQGISYDEFKKAQKDGYIGEEITYEYWNNLIKLNNQLEKSLENSDNFNKIYDSSDKHSIDYQKVDVSSIPYLQKGDILITNGTSVGGLTGHTAIAIGSDNILHIEGFGKTPETHTRSWFRNRYIKDSNDWIKIYRPKKSEYGIKAAKWAEDIYVNGIGKNAPYVIDFDFWDTTKTYCSKLVWQSYRYGLNQLELIDALWDTTDPWFNIIIPYTLDSTIKTTYEYKVS